MPLRTAMETRYLKSTSRNEYPYKAYGGLADRTLWAIGKQLADGLFIPDTFEKGLLNYR